MSPAPIPAMRRKSTRAKEASPPPTVTNGTSLTSSPAASTAASVHGTSPTSRSRRDPAVRAGGDLTTTIDAPRARRAPPRLGSPLRESRPRPASPALAIFAPRAWPPDRRAVRGSDRHAVPLGDGRRDRRDELHEDTGVMGAHHLGTVPDGGHARTTAVAVRPGSPDPAGVAGARGGGDRSGGPGAPGRCPR